ncbi:MAG: hypothetical protein ACXVRS_02370 [Gaiellaceae bacterium]
MNSMIRAGAVLVATVAAVAGSSVASADAVGGCPSGGGWALISPTSGPYPWGPVAELVDQRGNDDGFACKTVYTNGAGTVEAKVIDNRVQGH